MIAAHIAYYYINSGILPYLVKNGFKELVPKLYEDTVNKKRSPYHCHHRLQQGHRLFVEAGLYQF